METLAEKINNRSLRSKISMQIMFLLHSGKDKNEVINHIEEIASEHFAAERVIAMEPEISEYRMLLDVSLKSFMILRDLLLAQGADADEIVPLQEAIDKIEAGLLKYRPKKDIDDNCECHSSISFCDNVEDCKRRNKAQ